MSATLKHPETPGQESDDAAFQIPEFDPAIVAECLKDGRPLKELVNVDDRVWETMYDFGYRNFLNGQFAAAEYWWTQACLFESNRDRNWIALGVACKKQNKFTEALNAFSLAAHHGSTNPWSPMHAAECLIQLGQYAKAKMALDNAEEWLDNVEVASQLRQRIAMLRRGLERREQRRLNEEQAAEAHAD